MARKRSIADKIKKNIKSEQGSQFGYLKIPSDLKVFSAPKGNVRTEFDHLPYVVSDANHPDNSQDMSLEPGDLWYKRPFRIHRNIGVNKKRPIICPSSVGKACPICEYRADRVKAGASKKELEGLNSSLRNLYLIVPKKVKDHPEIPHLLDISYACYQKKLREEVDEKEKYATFANLEDGLTLSVRWADEPMPGGNTYTEASRIDFEARDYYYTDEFVDKLPDLDKIIKESVLDYKQIERMFFELEDEGPEDTPVEPAAQRPAPSEPKETEPAGIVRRPKSVAPAQEEKEPEEAKPAPTRTRGKPTAAPEPTPAPSNKEEKCPYGHRYGMDCDKYEDCEQCDLWDDCVDLTVKNQQEA